MDLRKLNYLNWSANFFIRLLFRAFFHLIMAFHPHFQFSIFKLLK